jgi:hypothetical protein
MHANLLKNIDKFAAHFLGRGDKLASHKGFLPFDDMFSTQLSTGFVDNRKTYIRAG